MQEKVPAKFPTSCFNPIEYHEEFPFTAQVKKLARNLASLIGAVSTRYDHIGVFLAVLPTFPLDQVSQPAVHEILGDRPSVRDEFDPVAGDRGIGAGFDDLVICC
jgi:hypothetical protein